MKKFMKRSLLFFALALVVMPALAQPRLTSRAINQFPASLPVNSNDIEWQRDVYREVYLDSCNNGVLAESNKPSLFRELFRLVIRNIVPAYEYNIDGNEVFSSQTSADIKSILSDYSIHYSEQKGKIIVNEEDFPDDEVRIYYIKEGVCFNSLNGQFYNRVLALCPVLTREDDFGDGINKYPLFWLKFADIEHYLKDFYVIQDTHNNAVKISAADYFAKNLYKGNIYKVYNPQGYSIPQYCETDSSITVERQRIDGEILKVKERAYTSSPTVTPSKYSVIEDEQPRAARKRSKKSTDKK